MRTMILLIALCAACGDTISADQVSPDAGGERGRAE